MLKTQMTVLELVVLSQILRRTFCEEQLVEAICDWAVSSQISFSERITRITTNYVVFLGKMTYYHNNYHPATKKRKRLDLCCYKPDEEKL